MLPDKDEEALSGASLPEALSIDEVLNAFAQGQVRASDVAALSELSSDEGAAFARRWPDLPEDERIAIARQMLELAEERVELLFGRASRLMLDDPSPSVRQLALATLWEDEGVDLESRLLAIIKHDPSPDVVTQAVQGLARFIDAAVMGQRDQTEAERLTILLINLATNEQAAPLVRRRALESVAALGTGRIPQLIDAFYGDDASGFRASALYAMGRTASRRWLHLVESEFQSEDAELRYEAARAAGEIADPQVLQALSHLTADEDVEVRQAAITAIGRIGGPAATRILRRLAESAEETDQDAIDEALEESESFVDPLSFRP